VDFKVPTLATYRARIERLPARVERRDILRPSFLLGTDGRLAAYYAPFGGAVNRNAQIVLVGITPGWTQTKEAYETCRRVLRCGGSERRALAEAKAQASFKGMRTKICRWLDELGVDKWLELDSTDELFDTSRDRLQTTSLIRYPVFVGEEGGDYGGAGKIPIKSPLLWSMVESLLVPQLDRLPDALVVPMGAAVATALRELGVEPARCLYGFPHPAYRFGERDFRNERPQMRTVVARLA
jgi:hypothetical protein